MSDSRVRPAGRHDSAFLALAMQEADRGHTGIGSWDVMFPGADEDRLATLAALRHVDYEQRFKTPGLVFLRRAL